jgi:rare lipoprotein A
MRHAAACVTILLCACLGSAWASPQHRVKPQVGKASIYSHRFAGKRMANGERMDPRSASAASKTLPLGTKARVTNLETGRSALVSIDDRGPFVPGRIVDVTPATAAEIGLSHKEGLAHVEVVPLELPK